MSESEELFASVNYIKHKVEALEKIQLLNLRSNKAQREEYINLLRGDNLLYEIYKAIDGKRAQREIALLVGVSDKNVSQKVQILHDNGLIELKKIEGNNRKIYSHSVAEQAYKLLKAIE